MRFTRGSRARAWRLSGLSDAKRRDARQTRAAFSCACSVSRRGCSVASVCERARRPVLLRVLELPAAAGNRNGRATSSAAPRAQGGARHGLGTLALAEDRHVMALRAIRRWLSVAPSNLGERGLQRGAWFGGSGSLGGGSGGCGGSVVAGQPGCEGNRACDHGDARLKSKRSQKD